MRFPLGMTTKLSTYIAGKRLRGVEKFPLVMMLEPLHACNLTCTGCGRIREYKSTITERHEAHKEKAALNPNKRGPKPKVKPPSDPDSE